LLPGQIENQIDLTKIPTLAILLLAITAAGTDLAFGRIFNWLTVGMGLLGITYAGFSAGFSGIGSSLLGVLVGLILYGWMFWIHVLGGGDVKLLMAFGAWGGAHYVLDVAFLGVLLGGAMALLILVLRGRIGGFFRRMVRFLRSIVIRELEVEKFQLDKKMTMPFGIPIAVAAVWIELASPLQRWGVHLW
jgi:prepilin peptidase CpaA